MAKPTAEDIVKWAEDSDKPSDTPAYKRITAAELKYMRELRKQGHTQTEIAQRLKRGQSTVSYWLNELVDTRDIATEYLRSSAFKMAQNIVENGLARDHIQALNGLNVLQAQENNSLTLVINGLRLAGTGRTETVEGEVLSPPLLEAGSEGAQNS